MFGLGAGEVKSARAGWAGQRGAGVSLNGLGGIETLRDGSWIKTGGAVSSSEGPSSGPWVEGSFWSCVGLVVKAEELMFLFFLGIQLYTTISYAGFGSIKVIG